MSVAREVDRQAMREGGKRPGLRVRLFSWEPVICPTCNGGGLVMMIGRDEPSDCPTCEGEGVVT